MAFGWKVRGIVGGRGFCPLPPALEPRSPTEAAVGGTVPKGRQRSTRGGVKRADEFSRPTEDGAGPQSPHKRPQSPQRSAHGGGGEGGKACTPTAINSIAGSLGLNSHRSHKWVLGSKPVQGLVGGAWTHTAHPGGRGRLPEPPAPGRQLWSTAHPLPSPSVRPQSKRGGAVEGCGPPGRGRSVPFFFLSLFLFFLLNFISRTAPSLLGTPRNCRALPLRLSRYRYLRPFGVAQSSLHVQFPSLGLFPLPPPFPSFCVRVPPFVPALREAAMKAAAAGP